MSWSFARMLINVWNMVMSSAGLSSPRVGINVLQRDTQSGLEFHGCSGQFNYAFLLPKFNNTGCSNEPRSPQPSHSFNGKLTPHCFTSSGSIRVENRLTHTRGLQSTVNALRCELLIPKPLCPLIRESISSSDRTGAAPARSTLYPAF